jgi:hypothetical protein
MEIEIKHIRPEVEKEKTVRRKELEDKYKNITSTTLLSSTILIFTITCFQPFLFIVSSEYIPIIIFSILPIILIVSANRNIQYLKYRQENNKVLMYILNVVSIAGNLLWLPTLFAIVWFIYFIFG